MYQKTDDSIKMAFMLFLIGTLSDSLDGILARALKKETKFGAILDQMADKIFVISIFLMAAILQLIQGMDLAAIFIILSRDLIMSGIRQYYVIQSDYLGKLKMNFQIFAIFFLFIAYLYSPLKGLDRLTLWTSCVLTLLSFCNYLRYI